jgi:hypothetical protein
VNASIYAYNKDERMTETRTGKRSNDSAGITSRSTDTPSLEEAWKEYSSYSYFNQNPSEIAAFATAFYLQRIANFLDRIQIPSWLLKKS